MSNYIFLENKAPSKYSFLSVICPTFQWFSDFLWCVYYLVNRICDVFSSMLEPASNSATLPSLPNSLFGDSMVWLEIGQSKCIYTTERDQLGIFLYRELSVTNIPLAIATTRDPWAGQDLRDWRLHVSTWGRSLESRATTCSCISWAIGKNKICLSDLVGK